MLQRQIANTGTDQCERASKAGTNGQQFQDSRDRPHLLFPAMPNAQANSAGCSLAHAGSSKGSPLRTAGLQRADRGCLSLPTIHALPSDVGTSKLQIGNDVGNQSRDVVQILMIGTQVYRWLIGIVVAILLEHDRNDLILQE